MKKKSTILLLIGIALIVAAYFLHKSETENELNEPEEFDQEPEPEPKPRKEPKPQKAVIIEPSAIPSDNENNG